MKVLVINAGSSSLKYQLIDMTTEQMLAKGNCERIGISGGFITQKLSDGTSFKCETEFPTHKEAFEKVLEMLTTGESAVISDMKEISAVGHRVVHGGEKFSASTLITDDVIKTVEDLADLAPLHNPPIAVAIRACQKVLGPDVPQVAVFDTAFHQTMPAKAYMYALPYEYYEKYGIRRYGFHGTSHRYVSNRLAKLMGKDIKDLKIITCHLGNGSSISAVEYGKCIDTSMGFTPLAGLVMGTRSGDIDPSVVPFIMEKENLTPAQVSDVMNKKSGYIGISGITSDDRDLRKAAAEGNTRAALAGEMQRYGVIKFIGAYAAAMNGADAIVFTGGIGENSIDLRKDVCASLGYMGVEIDENANAKFSGSEHNISAPGAKVQTWIVPTNEELMIAMDTMSIINGVK